MSETLKAMENIVYSRIGMALVSAQRVEFLTGEILKHLVEYDRSLYRITTEDFWGTSQKSKSIRRTLGQIFQLLKLNPKLVNEIELNEYLDMRNVLVHGFWRQYLNTKSPQQMEHAIEFCNQFGHRSDKLEKFFKGFLYLLALRHVEDRNKMTPEFKVWEKDFEYFMEASNN